MTKILDAIEQVRNRETEASLLLERTRLEAAALLTKADEEGRREHQRILEEARGESARLLEKGTAEVEAIHRRTEAVTRETIEHLEQASDEQVRRAVRYLIDQFHLEYGRSTGDR